MLIRKNPFFILAAVLFGGFIFHGRGIAQTDSVEYFKSFENPNLGIFYTGAFSRHIDIQTKSSGVKEKSVRFSPNSSAFAGLSLQYKKYFIYLETSLPNTHKVSPNETNVKGWALFLSRFKQKWGVTGFISYQKGLLMESTGKRPYADRGDIRRLSIGFHHYWIFNPSRFSYVAPNAGAKQQIRSAGSLMLMTTPSFQSLRSNGSIIPSEIVKYHFTRSTDALNSLQLYSLQVKPGYIYNFIWGKGQYFVSPAFYAGLGTDYHVFQKTTGNYAGLNVNTGYRMKMVAGINNENYYITLDCLMESTRALLYNSRLSNTYREASINFGIRF
jgi:hypothetical protein